MARQSIKPTDSELQILHVLWANGPQTVREVNDDINSKLAAKTKETGYTTTLKLMQIMSDKGLVTRDTSKRTHIYKADITESDTQQNLLETFVNTTFKGSAMSLVMQALGNHKASQEELDQIKQLINKLENQ